MTLPAGLSSVNLNLLVALDALLEEQSVTQAAARAGVSQSAMSQSLSQLRDLLEDQVLVRSGRNMVLTPRAAAMGAELHTVLGDLNRVLRGRPQFDPATLSRRLVISAAPDLAWLIAADLYNRLQDIAPGVHIVFDANGDPVNRLRAGTVDFVVGFELGGISGIRSHELTTASFRAVLRAGHPLAPPLGEPLSFESWAAIPQVVMGTVMPQRNPMDDFLETHGFSRTIAMFLPSAAACARVVNETDLCWNTVTANALAYQQYFTNLQTHELPLVPRFPVAELYWHARWDDDPGHNFLREILVESIMDAIGQPEAS